MNTKALSALNFFGLITLLITSFLTQAGKLSSSNVGEISAKYETLFAPADQTFAIWGLIYFSLLLFCIYHIYKAFQSPASDQANIDISSIGALFFINTLATALWLLIWVNEQIGLSVVLMLVQLITLILISIRAHIANPERPLASKIFTQFPLSIYFAWICIATIANISAFLVSVNWSGFGISPDFWVIILIGVATLLSLFIILVRRNFFFGMVILWALYGIVLKRQDADPVEFQNIINAAWAAFISVAIAMLIRVFRKKKFITQPSTSAS